MEVFIATVFFILKTNTISITKINGAVIISGSPGLRDKAARRIRSAQDEARAHFLLVHGLQYFLDIWYAGSLWKR